jgi:hypothetical protein
MYLGREAAEGIMRFIVRNTPEQDMENFAHRTAAKAATSFWEKTPKLRNLAITGALGTAGLATYATGSALAFPATLGLIGLGALAKYDQVLHNVINGRKRGNRKLRSVGPIVKQKLQP